MHEPDLGGMRFSTSLRLAASDLSFSTQTAVKERPAFHFHLTLNLHLDLAKKSEQQADLLLYSQPMGEYPDPDPDLFSPLTQI